MFKKIQNPVLGLLLLLTGLFSSNTNLQSQSVAVSCCGNSGDDTYCYGEATDLGRGVTVLHVFGDPRTSFSCGEGLSQRIPWKTDKVYVANDDYSEFYALPSPGQKLDPAKAKTSALTQVKPMSKEDLMVVPELAPITKITPFGGSGGCSISSAGKPLVLRPAANAKSADQLTLCPNKECVDPTQWAITPVDASKAAFGYYIHPVDHKDQVICWDARKGLALRNPGSKVDECMVWYVTPVSTDKGEIKGYRVVSKTARGQSLQVNKASGIISVKPIYKLVAQTGSDKKVMQLDESEESIWTLGNCKPLPSNNPNGLKDKTTKPADRN